MKKIIENSYDYLFIGMLLLLPFSLAFPSIVLGLLVFSFIIDIKKINFDRLKTGPFYILYFIFFFIFVKALINNSLIIDQKILSRYLFVLVIPILFLKIKDLEKIKTALIISIQLMIVVSIFKITKHYIIFNNFPLGDGLLVNELLVLERPYAGFMSLMGLILSLEKIRNNDKNKGLFIFFSIMSIFFIILIAARNSFITLLFLFFLYIFFYLKISKLYKLTFIGSCFLIILTIVSLNKNILERFHINKDIEGTLSKIAIFEPRYVIWPCAYDLTKQEGFNPIVGFKSENEISAGLINCYSQKISNESRKGWFLERKFNTHNQFIAFFLSSGIIGFLALVSFYFLSIYLHRHNFFAAAILISFLFFFLFENVLSRQFGCYIFAIFAALFLLKKQSK
ncbi:O-antigen ligase [Flavobacterium sp. 28YEA47A]|uniref:O-antigen ligase family protein n=1 Tax=Flavobacterium sp. 28YEA47A TaxID=3156276 RepID=UPI0035152EB1